MNSAIEVRHLTKQYPGFALKDVSFQIPEGSVVGFIGENGAGKSTTIKVILDLIKRDGGEITLLGEPDGAKDETLKEQIGVVFDENCFPDYLNRRDVNRMLKAIYRGWQEERFGKLCDRFGLPGKQMIKEYSRGMKMKLSISVALSHKAELLILDEATSGLDPVVRDDILDILLDFVQDETHSILISSHITSDLEKVADYIVFIHEGKMIFEETKDNLIYDYGIMKCKQKEFDSIDKEDIIRFRKMDYGYEILVKNKKELERKYPNFIMDNIKIEDIMLMYVKGEK